jgi:hypothetical protein
MANRRRDFHLSNEDVQFLDGLNLDWEAVQEGNQRAVIFYGFPFREPFQPNEVVLKIKLPLDYSSGAALDMFFTNVQVTRADGKIIPALTQAQTFDGKSWWQWSRHYPGGTKWRAGVDNLGTHISFVKNILHDEAGGKTWQ